MDRQGKNPPLHRLQGLPLYALIAGMLLVAGGWLSWSAYEDYLGTVEREYRLLEIVARQREARIDGALHSIELMLDNIAEDWLAAPRMPPAAANKLLANGLRQLPETRNLLIADAGGRVVASTNEKLLGFDASQREYFVSHRDAAGRGDRYHISHPFTTVTGVSVVTVSRALHDAAGRFVGVIVATMSPTLFENVLHFLTPTPDSQAVLIDRDGHVICGIPNPSFWVGKSLVGGIAYGEHLAAGKPTTRHLNRPKLLPQTSMSVFHDIPGTPLIVIVARDRDAVLAEWRTSLRNGLVGFGIVTATVVFLGWLAVRRQRSIEHAHGFARELIENANVMIVGLDAVGRVAIFNATAEHVTGYRREEIIGRDWFQVVVPKDRFPAPWEIFRRARDGGDMTATFENPIVTRDGELRTIAWQNSLLNNQEEGVVTVSFGVDVTDRKATAARLAEALAMSKAIVDESPVGIALFRADGPCVTANPACASLVGGTPEQIAATNFRRLEVWRRSGLLDTALDVLDRNVMASREVHTTSSFGNEIWLDCKLVPVELAGVRHLLLLATDIGGFRVAEEALREVTRAAEQANRAKSEFLANMSHEIRTPMNAVIGLSQLALAEAKEPRLRDYLEKIFNSSTTLLGILNDILDYSKIEAGRLRIEDTDFALAEVVDATATLLRTAAEIKGIGFACEIAADVPGVLRGDPLRLGQVLTNLAGNAVKFTERGDVRLTVTQLAAKGNRVRLRFEVADTGIGMTAEQLRDIFQPFVQADGSITRRFGGSGLGLTISRRLLQLMGSDIAVDSTPGEGSRFSFELELVVPDQPRTATTEAPAAPLAAVAAPIAGARILLVEDNAVNQQVARSFLERAGLSVGVAANGAEALAMLETQPFDAVLMDLQMPEMDGFEATRRIRADARFAALPIVALTASAMASDREKCLAAGMNEHIAKPLNAQRLIEVLRSVLAHGTPMAATAVATADAAGMLRALDAKLRGHEFVPAESLYDLRLAVAGEAAAAHLASLEKALAGYDYAGARQALQTLAKALDVSLETAA